MTNHDKHFEAWFFEGAEFSLRAERFFDSLSAMESQAGKEANLVIWLKAAFEAGWAAKEKSDALRENVLAGEAVVEDFGGYSEGTREGYDAFVAKRNYHITGTDNPVDFPNGK